MVAQISELNDATRQLPASPTRLREGLSYLTSHNVGLSDERIVSSQHLTSRRCLPEDVHLDSIERLAVAIYERAIKDWIQGFISSKEDRWMWSFSAAQWLLDDDMDIEYFSFRWVCEIMNWDREHVRQRSIMLFEMALAEKMRRRMVAAMNMFKKRVVPKWEKLGHLIEWALSDYPGDQSFTNACRLLRLDALKARGGSC